MKEKSLWEKSRRNVECSLQLLLIVIVMGIAATEGTVQGDVYAFNTAEILTLADDLSSQSVKSVGAYCFKDMAANSDSLYFVTAAYIFQYSQEGQTEQVRAANDLTTVALNGNGYVYAYNSTNSTIYRYDEDLSNQTVVHTGYGFGTSADMAAGSDALYFTDGSTLYRTNLDGTHETQWTVGMPSLCTIAVGGGGYVYGFTSDSNTILRWNADLSNQTIIYEGYGFGASADMAASSDALYFATGTQLYRTNLDGSHSSGTWYYSNGAVTVAYPIPEPTTLFLLMAGGISAVWGVRRKQ